jgi:hypothetical protein
LVGSARYFSPSYIILRITEMQKPSHHIKVKDQPPYSWLWKSIHLKQGKAVAQFNGGGHTNTTFKQYKVCIKT